MKSFPYVTNLIDVISNRPENSSYSQVSLSLYSAMFLNDTHFILYFVQVSINLNIIKLLLTISEKKNLDLLLYIYFFNPTIQKLSP